MNYIYEHNMPVTTRRATVWECFGDSEFENKNPIMFILTKISPKGVCVTACVGSFYSASVSV